MEYYAAIKREEHNKMDEFQKHYTEQKKIDIRVYTVWFQIYKILEQTKLIYADRKTNRWSPGTGAGDWLHKRTLWGNGMFCLDCGDSYIIYQNTFIKTLQTVETSAFYCL